MAVMRAQVSPDSGCEGIAARSIGVERLGREPPAPYGVHEPVRKLSLTQMVILGGALVAALAGLGAGAEARPPAALTLQALGPRMDFDLAAHLAAPRSPRAQLDRSARAGEG
jgi:hypothetical protein